MMDEIVRGLIPLMGNEFDSHDLILKLARDNQRRYIAELQGVKGDKPFQTLHSQIAKTIEAHADEFHLTREETISEDIFRQRQTCARWRR